MFSISLGVQHDFKNKVKMSLLFSDVFKTACLNNYNITVNRIEQVYRQKKVLESFEFHFLLILETKKVNGKNSSS